MTRRSGWIGARDSLSSLSPPSCWPGDACMDKDYVPAWLITILGLFSLTAVVAFAAFLHFYTKSEALRELQDRADQRLTELRLREGELNDRLPVLETRIETRLRSRPLLLSRSETPTDSFSRSSR